MFKTRTVSKNEVVEKWFQIDATGFRVGRIATIAAQLLLGKTDPLTRDYLLPKVKVVITNAEKIDMTFKKQDQKIYTRYTGYPGGLIVDTLGELMQDKPERVLEKAIRRMLPKNKRGEHIFDQNLYVYVGAEHKHTAQTPENINLQTVKI